MRMAGGGNGSCMQDLNKELAKTINHGVELCEWKTGQSISAMLKSKESDYQADKQELLKAIKICMTKYIQLWEAIGKHAVVFPTSAAEMFSGISSELLSEVEEAVQIAAMERRSRT